MPNYVKLPFQFEPTLLKEDLAKVADDEWIRHFNRQYYEGAWSVASLRSTGGRAKQIYPDPHSTEDFEDTDILARCEYVQKILQTIECEKEAARFMLLGAGARILEHRDYFIGVKDGTIRLHIPVITNPQVEFYLADELIEMREGELWYLDFYQKHRVENNSDADRIHLVLDCKVNDWLIGYIN